MKIDETKESKERCSICPWRKEMYRDDKEDVLNIYCMFPRCIWTKHIKKEIVPLKKRKEIGDD